MRPKASPDNGERPDTNQGTPPDSRGVTAGETARQLRYRKFEQECEEAGWRVENYRGRNFYDGPAVVCAAHEYQDIVRATHTRV